MTKFILVDNNRAFRVGSNQDIKDEDGVIAKVDEDKEGFVFPVRPDIDFADFFMNTIFLKDSIPVLDCLIAYQDKMKRLRERTRRQIYGPQT